MRARRRRLIRAILSAPLILGVALTCARPARGQDAQQTGRALFNEGVALFNKGDYDAACPKFEASLKAFPGIGTRGKLAECYEKVGRFASAWAAYREVAQLATRSGDPTREQVASERAKSLEPKLSYVTIVVPRGSEAPGLVVKRAGHEVERSKLGAAEPVDAGTMTIEASAPGRRPFSGQVTVAVGQSARFEVPPLDSLAAPTPPPPPPAPVTPTPPSTIEPPPVQEDPPQWQKPTGIVVMGLGIVGLGVGGAFGLAASSTYDSAFDDKGGCNRSDNTCDAAGQKKVDDARSQAGVSTALFIAGGALAATGLVIYLTAPSARRTGVSVAPVTYAGGGGLAIGGSLY